MLRSVTAAGVAYVTGLIALLGVLTACSGSSKGTGSTPTTSVAATSASTSAITAAATTESPTPSSASSDCSPTPAVVAAAAKFTEITKVSLVGGCGQITAATTLAPGALGSPSVTRAIAICTALTKVGYAGSVFGVSVEGKDGHELAASTKDQRQCI